ncbi:MAG: SDR family oxidoreductase [bacterium]
MNATEINPSTSKRWFVTGATGFIGRELIRQVLENSRGRDHVTVLVRPGPKTSAKQRFRSSIADIVPLDQARKVRVLKGDVTEKNFGLSESSWQELSRSTHIVHMAALTRFDASLGEARRFNVEGVKHVIELAKKAHSNGCLAQWAHVSTAYVSGARTDLVSPPQLDNGGHFRNTYEQTKNEAEKLLQRLMDRFPLTIFRPSIVVGHSRTGKAGNFNTVYWSIRSYLGGQTKIYANPNTPLDLVPVDYVVDAMYHLIDNRKALGKIVMLAGGNRTTVPLLEFTDRVCRYLDSPMPEITDPKKLTRMKALLALAKLSKRHRQFIQQAESYLPYFCQNPTFEISETERLLRDTDIRVPELYSYLGNLLDYCLDQSWGKRSRVVGTGYRSLLVANAC